MLKILFGKMSNTSRIILAISASLLLISFVAPLWRIELCAPQYPEGLSMFIWSNKFSGDITTVNILNHYIGMARIEAANFPELQIFPLAFGILAGIGVLAALIGRKILSNAWVIGMFVFSIWSMYDFYNWEYKFGHELNPDAAIKMDDMVYQPPLFGTKNFLNITASSYPDIAGIAFAVAVLLSFVVLFLNYKQVDKLD